MPSAINWQRDTHQSWSRQSPCLVNGPKILRMRDHSKMGVLEFSSPRTAWGGEATDFTPALAERLDYLGEVTGLGNLELVGVEAPTGARRIDVLASIDDRRVVIENQYGRGDHDHLTRGLAYAVAEGAAALVVIAETHGDEFVAVADYLNDLTMAGPDQRIGVWLVEVEAVRRVGDAVWSPLFRIRTQPNSWEQGIRVATNSGAASPHAIRSIDEFLAMCESPEVVRWLIHAWRRHPGSLVVVGGKANPTLQLRHPDPVDPKRGHAAITVYSKGGIWLNYVYLRDSSGAFEGDDELLAAIRSSFPSAAAKHPGDMPNWLSVSFEELESDRDLVESFFSWLKGQLDIR